MFGKAMMKEEVLKVPAPKKRKPLFGKQAPNPFQGQSLNPFGKQAEPKSLLNRLTGK